MRFIGLAIEQGVVVYCVYLMMRELCSVLLSTWSLIAQPQLKTLAIPTWSLNHCLLCLCAHKFPSLKNKQKWRCRPPPTCPVCLCLWLGGRWVFAGRKWGQLGVIWVWPPSSAYRWVLGAGGIAFTDCLEGAGQKCVNAQCDVCRQEQGR